MDFKVAKDIAVSICYKLQPHCVDGRLNIAGSVRRLKSDPKDIEIICVAKKMEVKNLFGEVTGKIKNASFIHTVSALGNVIKGTPMGRMMQIELPEGIVLDLFMPDEADYFRIFSVRTGSADYSHKVLATAWNKKGWCGSDKGFRKMIDCIEMRGPDGKSKWKCVAKNPELAPIWQSEESFFKWLGVPFIHPSKRTI